MLAPATLPRLQDAIRDADLDGWLLFDFHGVNPIAAGMLRLEGFTSRRCFAWIPADGTPTALSNAIEQGPWRNWPREWEMLQYSGWRSLESSLAKLVGGKRVAMEYSPGDAVPYLDRIPAGVLEMVQAAGAMVVSSADLVTAFYAVWTEADRESHERAAAVIAGIAQTAMRMAGERASSQPMTEYELAQWILARFPESGLSTDHGPIVAVGPNAANAHYEPIQGASPPIERGAILLIDLWAKEEGGVFADQTWMASLGKPGGRDVKVWTAVREGRDAAIDLLRTRLAAGTTVKGADVDDAARSTIERHGFGDRFIHRTGHSIDSRDLHGSGPHLDNFETREERALVPGVGFSIEPGIYIPGEVGMRSEVNAFIAGRELLVTPMEYQRDLLIV
ncbi:MAG TPA: M24 family metallopeptidase [Gemmatimonadaceae bacterium]|nr:M24 family metallopeptidase [Gemmatimonadaceae bacterium]